MFPPLVTTGTGNIIIDGKSQGSRSNSLEPLAAVNDREEASMAGMETLDASRSEDVYLHLDERIERAPDAVLCYSRLPMRQLLRYVSTNTADMWWLSEHETPRAVVPNPTTVEEHIKTNTRETTSLVILEGIDWLVRRSDESTVLAMLQVLDGLAKERGFELVLAGDSLALNPTFWARMCSLAPKIQTEAAVSDRNISIRQPESIPLNEPTDTFGGESEEGAVLVHLVNLPRIGFTHAVLARRMLQWKRMGFDLAALEPAMATHDMDKAHTIYSAIEQEIILAIDSLRLMEQHGSKLTVSEREMFNFRLMALNRIPEAADELLALLSTR